MNLKYKYDIGVSISAILVLLILLLVSTQKMRNEKIIIDKQIEALKKKRSTQKVIEVIEKKKVVTEDYIVMRPRLTEEIQSTIESYGNKYNIDPALLVEIAFLESGLRPTAINSGKNKYGLFQIEKKQMIGNLAGIDVMKDQTPETEEMIKNTLCDIELNTFMFVIDLLDHKEKKKEGIVSVLKRMGKSDSYIDKLADNYYGRTNKYLSKVKI